MRKPTDAALKALRDARFAIQSVAHIQGFERELLPMAEQLTEFIDKYAPESETDLQVEYAHG